jgi:hypothetical protein
MQQKIASESKHLTPQYPQDRDRETEPQQYPYIPVSYETPVYRDSHKRGKEIPELQCHPIKFKR